MVDEETLGFLTPYAYVRDLLRDGFVVRRRGGRAGTLIYSEGWRNAHLAFELVSGSVSVDLRDARWWRLPVGIPFLPLTHDNKQHILKRLQSRGQYEEFAGSLSRDEIVRRLSNG